MKSNSHQMYVATTRHPQRSRGGFSGLAVFASATVIALSAGVVFAQAADLGPDRFRIYTEETGMYSVTFEELQSAGLKRPAVPSRLIGVSNRGTASAYWVDDGGDGSFDSGDRVVFQGERLLGTYSYLDEYSRFNCYILDLSGGVGGAQAVGQDKPDSVHEGPGLFVSEHFEEDIVMGRFLEKPDEPKERWFWARLSIMDKKPFRMTTTLRGLDEQVSTGDSDSSEGALAATPIKLTVAFKGWSSPRVKSDMPDHVVEFTANGQILGNAEWSGSEPFIHEVFIQPESVGGENLQLEIAVPRRRVEGSSDLFVDVVLLNWIEIEYPRTHVFDTGQNAFWAAAAVDGNGELEIEAAEDGWLFVGADQRFPLVQGTNSIQLNEALNDDLMFAVVGDGFLEIDRIASSPKPYLRPVDQQVDYILITHESLAESVKPLAEFHRKRGLTVLEVDIEDIYDEFNFGIQNPASIKDFISWGYNEWKKPAPRFVLLAGDASWDFKNPMVDDTRYADWTFRAREKRRFIKNRMTPYEEGAELNDRNLVPTWSFRSSQGHSASDNWYVSVEGDDMYPDLAVGRIPVTRPEEMAAVVQKTISYVESQDRGEWQRRVLFITNESEGFQRASERTAEIYEERGYDVTRIYPQKDELVNEGHTANILDKFDEGLLLVQFLGHGGRYIWRTGPPDLKKNHDLFTLDHLDQLTPSERLPVVISLTCYSAPFDHPSADSIGEKLLRIDGKGAVAVFAASWRNSPSSDMGRIVFDELTRPGATIGEAIMRAKGQIRNSTLVETYNLLGDPAIPVAVPEGVLPPPEEEAEVAESSSAPHAEAVAATGASAPEEPSEGPVKGATS